MFRSFTEVKVRIANCKNNLLQVKEVCFVCPIRTDTLNSGRGQRLQCGRGLLTLPLKNVLTENKYFNVSWWFLKFYLVTVAGEKEKWSFILWFHPEEVFQISPVQVFTHQPPSRKMRDQIRSRVLHPLCHRRNETGTNNSINHVYSCEYIIRWRDGDLNPQHGLIKHVFTTEQQVWSQNQWQNFFLYQISLDFSDFSIKIDI